MGFVKRENKATATTITITGGEKKFKKKERNVYHTLNPQMHRHLVFSVSYDFIKKKYSFFLYFLGYFFLFFFLIFLLSLPRNSLWVSKVDIALLITQ